MKLFYCLIILVLFQNCSFDKKSGIWKNEKAIPDVDKDYLKELETLSSSNKLFDKIIPVDRNFKFKLTSVVDNFDWNDIFFKKNNNLQNFKYNDLNRILFKSKKLSRHSTSNFIMFEDGNVILSDFIGNIIVFSINQKKIITKFNFYKKKHKKINKLLNFIVENNTIYVSDNLGYLYALDYRNNKILWAKNYKVPFRSNLKLFKNKLIASNLNNSLFFFDKNNGNNLKLIPTEETIVKNQFKNNLSLDEKTLFFLNTYGSLYSIDNESMRINWFINLNQSLDLNPSNLFLGHPIINENESIIVSSNQFTYIVNKLNGSIKYKKNFSSQIKPIMLNNYLFLITKNNLLIAMDIQKGEIIYSTDINQSVAEYLNIKKKKVKFKNLMISNNKILIFLENSYVIKFSIMGNIEQVYKLPTKINSFPIFINSSMVFLNKKNKVSIID
jgi:outer membrane protein assembly factor BamB